MPIFQSGMTADPSLAPGTWLAYMRPDAEKFDGPYGPAFKLSYNVFVPGRNGTRRFEQSELASPQYTTGAKLIRRFAAVNNVDVTDSTDLGSLKEEGFCLVQLRRKKESQYLEIAEVMPLPRGYTIPADITNPAEPPIWTQDAGQSVAAVDELRQEEWDNTVPSHLTGNVKEEPPF